MKPVRCILRRHDIPKNGITEYYGAVWRGGYCLLCNTKIRGKFLFNAWDDGKTALVGRAYHLTGTNSELAEGLENGDFVWA